MPIRRESTTAALPATFINPATDNTDNKFIIRDSLAELKYINQTPTVIPPVQRVVIDMSGMENPGDTPLEPGEDGGGL